MTLQSWANNGWLKKHQTSKQEITQLLEIVERDLNDAKQRKISSDWRFGIAYNAALKLCTILMYIEGFKPEKTLAHYRTLQALPLILGSKSLKNKYLLVKTTIDGLYRKETLEFPELVLREAIANAVVHREYIGAHIQIKIFPDKLIIWNEGGLPSPLTVADLKVIHPSRPRNELIADVFFKAGLIETWGHGTLKMVEICKEAGLREPIYAEEFGGFSVTFSKSILDDTALSSYDLNERQRKALKSLKEKTKISNRQYQELNDVSKGTATKELSAMVNAGLLVRIGTRGAGTFYRLKT